MRRKIKNKYPVKPEAIFESMKVAKLINYVMYSGKKNIARDTVYGCFDLIKEKAKVENPIEVFESALKNTAPAMEVRSRRVGGANYQVPREVRPERRQQLGMKWIIMASKSKKGQPMHVKLANELIDAYNKTGATMKKREDMHRMAEANKAFSHYRW